MQCYGVKQSFVWFIVGAVVCVVGGILYIFMPDIVDDIMAMELALSSSSMIYPIWQEIPVPIYRSFYLFNYTNAAEFNANPQNVTPIVQEIGPFVYRELREKVFISWNSDGEFVQYRETHTYPFQPSLSDGWQEDQPIWTPNIPLATILGMINQMLSRQSKAIKEIPPITYSNVIIQLPAHEIIWNGYYNNFIDWAQNKVLEEEILPSGMFALFYGKNATDDCEYEINRGTKDISQEFEIKKWNKTEYIQLDCPAEKFKWLTNICKEQHGCTICFKSEICNGIRDRVLFNKNCRILPFWGGEYCNMINGSDGTMYNSKITPDDRVYIFISDMCRSIFLDYKDDESYRGYMGHLFTSNNLLFADPGTYPQNECFCAPDGKGCYAPGLSNLGPCKFDAPVFLSHPHFLWVDEDVQQSIIGLSPDEERHRSEVNIEPNSGMLLWIDIRFQISVKITPLASKSITLPSKLPDYQDLPEIMLPVIWLDENAKLDDERISMLHHDLFIPMNVAYAVPIVIMSLGGAAVLIGLSCMISLLCTQKRKEDKIKKQIAESYDEY